ncbi:MAG: hypothetical protein KDD25_03575 [Bdellovibrionales bacterium]|nr:hypothetical protein [Bdellovibrionales bacterium]
MNPFSKAIIVALIASVPTQILAAPVDAFYTTYVVKGDMGMGSAMANQAIPMTMSYYGDRMHNDYSPYGKIGGVSYETLVDAKTKDSYMVMYSGGAVVSGTKTQYQGYTNIPAKELKATNAFAKISGISARKYTFSNQGMDFEIWLPSRNIWKPATRFNELMSEGTPSHKIHKWLSGKGLPMKMVGYKDGKLQFVSVMVKWGTQKVDSTRFEIPNTKEMNLGALLGGITGKKVDTNKGAKTQPRGKPNAQEQSRSPSEIEIEERRRLKRKAESRVEKYTDKTVDRALEKASGSILKRWGL